MDCVTVKIASVASDFLISIDRKLINKLFINEIMCIFVSFITFSTLFQYDKITIYLINNNINHYCLFIFVILIECALII